MRIHHVLLILSPFLVPSPSLAQDNAAGLEAWNKIFKVFSHPRCANCHTDDDYPRWSGKSYGEARIHPMSVVRGENGFGVDALPCQTCHGNDNSKWPHSPPGAPAWHLAPVEMAWFGKSSAHICAQIKDPARNGEKTLQEVAEHVRDDDLVAWGWQPGSSREPAPGSANETYNIILAWAQAGAPCPAE